MQRSWRRLVSFLLTIFLANMMAWSFSSAALADWLTEERAQITNLTADTHASDSHPDEPTCNHGCHAASHLQGQTSNSLPLFAPDAGRLVFLDKAFFLPPGIAQRQFRPPRYSSQA